MSFDMMLCSITLCISVSPYPYASLRSLTSGFHESFKIGEGAFGSVFKGQLPSETKVF